MILREGRGDYFVLDNAKLSYKVTKSLTLPMK